MQGKIIRGVGGFYYVHDHISKIYQCRAKGIFRKLGVKPLVGDEVEIQILDEQDREGNLEKILPRRVSLIRPAVANVDQALVIFAIKNPTKRMCCCANRWQSAVSSVGAHANVCAQSEIIFFVRSCAFWVFTIKLTHVLKPSKIIELNWFHNHIRCVRSSVALLKIGSHNISCHGNLC